MEDIDLTLFRDFGKVARLNRSATITEKIHGCNMQVVIAFAADVAEVWEATGVPFVKVTSKEDDMRYCIAAGSRNRWVGVANDHYYFAAWVVANAFDLLHLGVGRHFGEWWGYGIQHGYGIKEKRFSLFNTHRWGDPQERPQCCEVVPILYEGLFTTDACQSALEHLRRYGSEAAPGFMRPEGIVIWHDAARTYFKVTLERDEAPKSVVIEAPANTNDVSEIEIAAVA